MLLTVNCVHCESVTSHCVTGVVLSRYDNNRSFRVGESRTALLVACISLGSDLFGSSFLAHAVGGAEDRRPGNALRGMTQRRRDVAPSAFRFFRLRFDLANLIRIVHKPARSAR
jgi:hypothetical protein